MVSMTVGITAYCVKDISKHTKCVFNIHTNYTSNWFDLDFPFTGSKSVAYTHVLCIPYLLNGSNTFSVCGVEFFFIVNAMFANWIIFIWRNSIMLLAFYLYVLKNAVFFTLKKESLFCDFWFDFAYCQFDFGLKTFYPRTKFF